MASTSSCNLTTVKAVNLNSNKRRRRKAGCLWKKAVYTNLYQHIKLNRVNKCVCVFVTEPQKFSPQHCYFRVRYHKNQRASECESERERVPQCGNRVAAATFHTLLSPQKDAAPVSCQTRYSSQQRGA